MNSQFATFISLGIGILFSALRNTSAAGAPGSYVPFEGEKTTWHDGFERFDYVMDEETFVIAPFKCPDNEKFAVGNPEKGTATVHCHRAEAAGFRQPLVVARLLLGSRTANRSRIAPARFSHRVHHA
jgi:hypothetical protein